jgi:hypothetical protein
MLQLQKTLSTKIYDNIPEHPRFMGTTAVQNHIEPSGRNLAQTFEDADNNLLRAIQI